MARTKKTVETPPLKEYASSTTFTAVPLTTTRKEIAPLTHEFSNGELNILRDKINEIIKER